MKAFFALLRRDALVAVRDLGSFLIRTLMQPVFLVFVFGNVMARIQLVNADLRVVMLPGVIALSMLFAGMQAVTLPLVMDLGWTKEIEDRLLAPISVQGIAIEKLVVGMLHSLLSGLAVLPVAWLLMTGRVPLDFHHPIRAILLAIVIGFVSSALGLVLGTVVNPEKIGLMFSLIIAPIIFFGCTYYPWASLHSLPWLQKLVLLNPLVYMSEALRATLTPQLPHMNLLAIAGGLLVSLTLFTWIGIRTFRRRVID